MLAKALTLQSQEAVIHILRKRQAESRLTHTCLAGGHRVELRHGCRDGHIGRPMDFRP